MTNEQMGILLDWIWGGLESAISKLEKGLNGIEGIERHANLYKDGKYWGRPDHPLMPDFESTEELERQAEEEGLEVRYEGRPVILDELYALLYKLQRQERILTK